MAEIVGVVVGLLGPAIELGKCIVVPIKRQFNYLCCFNSNIQNLRDEVSKLENVRDELQMRVTRAQNNAEVIFPRVETWLGKANENIQITKEIESEKANVQSGWLAVRTRFSLSRRAKKMTEAMRQLRDDCRNFDVISQPAPPAATASVPLGSTYQFGSRKKIEDDIVKTLRDEKVNVMGICGMGGVGKTTMAERVVSRVRKEDLFDETVMAGVSQNVDMLRIQDDIAKSLGLELEEGSSLLSRAQQMHARLTGGRRILIVLDDVWKKIELKELGIPRESGSEGCRILITSRNSNILKEMHVQKVFKLKVLSETEAWCLFKSNVGTCVDDPNVLSVAQEVVEECKGLPIALVTVGVALKDQKKTSIWKDVLQQLKSSNPRDMQGVLDDVYKPLRASYELLKNERAKSLFLLCCLFPEDYNIPLQDLAVYAMGLRMFEEIKNLEDARNKTFFLVEILKSRFLLLGGGSRDHVKMHDIVRDVAIFIAAKEMQLIRCGDGCSWMSPFLGEKIELSNRSTFPNFRLLSLIGQSAENKINDNSFEGMINLNVLSVRRNGSLRLLPHTTQLSKNLRTLLLDACPFLETMSNFGELENLEILICRRCRRIKELPVEIGKLNRLRLLEMSKCARLKKIAPGVISNLDKLEELKMVESFDGWEAGDIKEGKGRNNAGLRELESLSCLTCLEIEIEDSTLAAEQIRLPSNIEKFKIRFSRDRSRPLKIRRSVGFDKILHLDLPGEISLGRWIDRELLGKAEYLESVGDGPNNLDLAKAQNMRSLILESCSTMKKLGRTRTSIGSATVFPLLESLVLYDLPKLRNLCNINAPIPDQGSSDSFKNLKKLKLRSLPALKHLWKHPSQDVVSSLSSIGIDRCGRLQNLFSLAAAKDSCDFQLKRLRISHCKLMKEVLLWDQEEIQKDAVESRSRRHIRFPNLKKLRLSTLPNLTTFVKGMEGIEFPQLDEMYIGDCRQLKSLVFSNTSSSTNSSRNNSGGISNDHDHYDDDSSPDFFCRPEKVAFGSLKKLSIKAYPNASILWCHKIPNDFFSRLEELRIEDCGNIRSLFSSSIAQNLINLKLLSVGKCNEMAIVIEDKEPRLQNLSLERLPELKSFGQWRCALEKLELRDMPNLTTFCKGIESIELPTLTEMKIRNCPNLKSLVSTTSSSSGGINHDDKDDDSLHLFCKPKVVFGRLEKLEISRSESSASILGCRKIPNGFFAGLKMLLITDCDNIKSLFSSSIAENLVNLEELGIYNCREMVKVIEDNKEKDGSGAQTTISLFPRLRELDLSSLPKLGNFCKWRSCALVLPSLESIKISSCPQLKRFSLGSLTTPRLSRITIDNGSYLSTKDLNVILQQHFFRVREEEKKKNKIEEEEGEEMEIEEEEREEESEEKEEDREDQKGRGEKIEVEEN